MSYGERMVDDHQELPVPPSSVISVFDMLEAMSLSLTISHESVLFARTEPSNVTTHLILLPIEPALATSFAIVDSSVVICPTSGSGC